MAKIDVSIIVPAYNEADIIKDTLTQLERFIHQHHDTLGVTEVIVVAAGNDKTADIARSFQGQFDHLQVVTPPSKVGKGRDIRLGFAAATGEVQLFFDADLCTPLPHILEMVKLLRDKADIVIGTRQLSKIHTGKLRSLISVGSNLLIRILLWRNIRDTQCGFKGFRATAAKHIFGRQKINGWGFDVETLVLANEQKLSVAQLPIDDWQETRTDDLRGENILGVAFKTLGELLQVVFERWGRFLVRHFWWLLGLHLVASTAIIGWVGARQSIWFDEAYSAALIRKPIGKLIHFTGLDVHPPLYYLLLKGWAALFGHSELALRSLSMIAGLAAGVVGILLVRKLFSTRAAALAIPFVTFAPFLLRFYIEARMYALASLICISATYVLVCALETTAKRKRLVLWASYALLVTLGMYTLYYTALIWIVHGVWCTTISKSWHPRKLLKQPWVYACVTALILYIPWIGKFIGQLGNIQSGFWIGPITYKDIFNVFSMAVGYQPQWKLDSWRSVIALAALWTFGHLVFTAYRLTAGAQRKYYLLFVLYTFLPILILTVASLPPLQPVFVERYFSHTLLGGYLLAGISTAIIIKTNRVKAIASVCFLLAIMLTGISSLRAYSNLNFQNLSQPRAQQTSAFLASQHATNDTVLIDGLYLYFEFEYYIDSPHLFFYDGGNLVTETDSGAMLYGSPQEVQKESELPHGVIWLVYQNTPSINLSSDGYHEDQVFKQNGYTVVKAVPNNPQ
jgi:glycosyltransferase involved in cell wall biosynthesis